MTDFELWFDVKKYQSDGTTEIAGDSGDNKNWLNMLKGLHMLIRSITIKADSKTILHLDDCKFLYDILM